jgi:hypothetical protein
MATKEVPMTYLGEVKDGVVVLKNAPPLHEGTVVRVEVSEPPPEPRPGSREAMLACTERWVGDPEELDRLLEEVQRDREADLTLMDDEE